MDVLFLRINRNINVKIYFDITFYFYDAGIVGMLEPLKEQIHLELAQKLTATDALLKDSIGKMCRSRVRIAEVSSYLNRIECSRMPV